MGLYKLGILTGERSRRFYVRLMVIGYVLGLPIVAMGALRMFRNDFDPVSLFSIDMQINYVGSIPVMLGHVGLIMLLHQAGAWKALFQRLQAVGRTAFSNYILQSLICSTIFYGYGLSQWGKLNRAELMLVVLGVWILQLLISPLWLARFHYGPLEWAWRTLSYGSRPPFRRRASVTDPS